MPVDHHRLTQAPRDPTSDCIEVSGSVQVLAEHDELVTAHASEHVGRTKHIAHALGLGNENPIPDLVAVAVVVRLEAVEVNEHQAHPARMAGQSSQA